MDIEINNQNIFPCSPFLMKKYKCHINVEYCASFQTMKYLFKYQYKGHVQVWKIKMKKNKMRSNSFKHGNMLVHMKHHGLFMSTKYASL